jgi:DNA polymerase epsilon subunit 2
VRAAVHALRGERQAVQALHVISAFDVPRVVYDPVAKRLLAEAPGPGNWGGSGNGGGGGNGNGNGGTGGNSTSSDNNNKNNNNHNNPLASSLLPDAPDKHRVYLDRYHLLYQRLRRNKRFQPRTALAVAGVRVPSRGGGGGPGHPPAPSAAAPSSHHHQHVALTEIMGLKGCVGERHIVMGLLSTSDDGQYVLEDAGAAVPLDLSGATVASGLVTENCVVVAEGEMGADGRFHAAAAGFPSCEPRSALPATAQALDFFGGPPTTPEDREAAAAAERDARAAAADGADVGEHRLVFLSDVALDRPGTLDALHTVFAGFQSAAEAAAAAAGAAAAGAGGGVGGASDPSSCLPAAFVLMGDFWAGGAGAACDDAAATGGGAFGGGSVRGCDQQAGAAGGGGAGPGAPADFLALRDAFASLAAAIDQYPRLRDGCTFVFVPGPNDPGLGDLLPAPPLAPYFTRDLRRVLPAGRAVFASNPCRLRYHGREVVVFRHDLMAAMRRRVLVPPAGLEALELHQEDLAREEADIVAGRTAAAKGWAGRKGAAADDTAPDGGGADAGGPPAAGDDTAVRRALFAHLVLTLLQQSHLCPLPLVAQPVHWRHDRALSLYPLPHAVVLGDGTAPQAAFRHEGCTVLCPGSLRDREFSVYLPFGGAADAGGEGGGGDDDVEPSVLPGGPGADEEAARREARLRAHQEAEAARWAERQAEAAAAAVAAAAEAPMDWLASAGRGAAADGDDGDPAAFDRAAVEDAAADGAAAEAVAAAADAEGAAAEEEEEEEEEEEGADDGMMDDDEAEAAMPAEPTTAEEYEMVDEQELGAVSAEAEEEEAAEEDEDGDSDGGAPAPFGSPVAPAAEGGCGRSGGSDDDDEDEEEAPGAVSGGEDGEGQ